MMTTETDQRIDVLMIEDDVSVRSVMSVALTEAGFHVMEATTGCAAMEILKKTPPRVVLLDIGLPDIEGFEICKSIKSDELLMNIPVIIVSGRSSLNHKLTGFISGAKAYINKPFHMDELIEKVRYFTKSDNGSATDDDGLEVLD
jgi:DNA-binding response OmpR family regulator